MFEGFFNLTDPYRYVEQDKILSGASLEEPTEHIHGNNFGTSLCNYDTAAGMNPYESLCILNSTCLPHLHRNEQLLSQGKNLS